MAVGLWADDVLLLGISLEHRKINTRGWTQMVVEGQTMPKHHSCWRTGWRRAGKTKNIHEFKDKYMTVIG